MSYPNKSSEDRVFSCKNPWSYYLGSLFHWKGSYEYVVFSTEWCIIELSSIKFRGFWLRNIWWMCSWCIRLFPYSVLLDLFFFGFSLLAILQIELLSYIFSFAHDSNVPLKFRTWDKRIPLEAYHKEAPFNKFRTKYHNGLEALLSSSQSQQREHMLLNCILLSLKIQLTK